MTETEREPFEGELFSLLEEKASVEARTDHIQHSIIPRMNARRGRGDLSREEIVEKLTSYNPFKRGEEHELTEALREGEGTITPELTLEIADCMYLWLQKKCPEEILEEAKGGIYILLGDWNLALGFCILKYETRLVFGDDPNTKGIERQVMVKHLEQLRDHPALRGFL